MADKTTEPKTGVVHVDSTGLLDCLLCNEDKAYIMEHYMDDSGEHIVCEIYCPMCAGIFGWGMDKAGTLAELKKHSNRGINR